MNTVKPWYKSISLWSSIGIVLTLIVVGVLNRRGITLTSDERSYVDGLLLVLSGVAGWGRYRATDQLSPTPTNPSKFVPCLLCGALAGLMLSGGGCAARTDLIQTRETMYLGTRTMRAEHLQWARQLGPGGDLTKLPHLTAADVALRQQWENEYESYVANSRAHDGDGGFNPFGIFGPPATQPSK